MAEIFQALMPKSGEARDKKLLDLAEKVRDGGRESEKAFEKIVSICEKGVYELALGTSRNREDALDVTQDTFIKLWQLLSGDADLSEVRSLYSYLLKMARNCALDHMRKQSIRRHDSLFTEDEDGEQREMDIPDEDVSSNPVLAYERDEKIRAVREAIASLDDDYRQILILRETEGCSYKEISDIMGIEMGTVKSKIFRARNHVKEYLEKRNIF